MKIATLLAACLVKHGVRHVFGISGGAILHMIHAVVETKGMRFVCPQTEQAAGFAADAYARVYGIGCAMATSGPGATNLITAIASSYYDSIPVVYVTGNVTRNRMVGELGVRQRGFQETPIVDMCKGITNYAVTLMEPGNAVTQLELAISLSKCGRSGPVLVDIPDDVQRIEI